MQQRYIISNQNRRVVRDTLHCINYHLATEAEAASIQEDLNSFIKFSREQYKAANEAKKTIKELRIKLSRTQAQENWYG